MTNHQRVVRTYRNETLACIVRDLSRNGQWRDRLKAAIAEQARRKTTPARQP